MHGPPERSSHRSWHKTGIQTYTNCSHSRVLPWHMMNKAPEAEVWHGRGLLRMMLSAETTASPHPDSTC